MFKKGPLSKAECFYLQHNYKLDISQLSSDLNRPVDIIEKWIKKNISDKPATIRAGDHFIRNDKGAVIMTENASTLSDAKRKRNITNQSCITKIKND